MKRATPLRRSKPSPASTDFARCLVRWHVRAGRHDLPWQSKPTPYRVWISEIMLQQTQVSTVIGYFNRFMQRFPDAKALAAAELDEVLELWSGLGYYARGRNIHKSARAIVEQFHGQLPQSLEELVKLPGIGRSTAGAILALGSNLACPILDGNVKRVLCRYFAVPGWPGEKSVEQKLWAISESLLPRKDAAIYTQAIMDLGATVCTRSRPACPDCPLNPGCLAHARERVVEYPAPRPARAVPVRSAIFTMIRNRDGAILLERRPPTGIWGGLWSFPECPVDEEPQAWVARRFGIDVHRGSRRSVLRHTFTHFHLDIEPVLMQLRTPPRAVRESADIVWHRPGSPLKRGVAAPVRKLIEELVGE